MIYWAVYDYGSRRLYGVYEASQESKARTFLKIVRQASKDDKTKWTILVPGTGHKASDKQIQFKYWGRSFLIRDIVSDSKPIVGTNIDSYEKAILSETGF